MSVVLEAAPEESPAEAPPRPNWKRLARFGCSAVILGWVAAKTDWAQVTATVRGLRWSAALASFGVLLAAQVVSALRWQWLARPLGFHGPLRRYVGYYFVGMFFNLLLPTSVGGDAIRAVYLNNASGRPVAAVLSVLLDRLSGLLVLLGVACVATLVCPVPLPAWVQLAVAAAALAAMFGLSLSPWMTGVVARLDVTGDGLRHRVLAKLSRLAESTRDALAVYRRAPRLILSSTALSALVQASSVLQVGLLGLAVGLDVPWAVYGVAAPMVALLTLLPISLNGMGVREVGMALFLAPAGVPREQAVIVAFLWFLTQTAAGLLGSGVYLAGRSARSEVRHDDAVGHHPDQGRAGQRRPAA
jgi:uncharacterized protein (TIRG00374 family)